MNKRVNMNAFIHSLSQSRVEQEKSAKRLRVNSYPSYHPSEVWPSYTVSQNASFVIVKTEIILPGLLSTFALVITSNAMETPSAQEVSENNCP